MKSLGLDPSTVFANQKLWAVFRTLAIRDEPFRREHLRPHEDAFTRGKRVTVVRLALDRALDALTQIEIFFQCHPDAFLNTQIELPQRAALTELIGSDSFLRYLNSYLYFGVRMFLRRYFAPREANFKDKLDARINRQPWWLTVPPPVGDNCSKSALMQVPDEADNADIAAALSFLDGTVAEELHEIRDSGNLSQTLELWMRRLKPELQGPIGEQLEQVVRGLTAWAKRQATFYLVVAGHLKDMTHPLPKRPEPPERGWPCDTPVIARVALGDLYWISCLLRTDVTDGAEVTNRSVSWLGLLRFRAALSNDGKEQQDLQATEEILRQVFGACCDLVQNSYELACAELPVDPQKSDRERSTTTTVGSNAAEGWRTIFDAELDEVSRQRNYREYGPGKQREGHNAAGAEGWSRHLYTGDTVPDLVGLAFSGGGIRSATFNLGVLQGLQELDVLRQIDYLSTVSGGGFTGSWLVGNVKRSTYWLGRLTPWDDSIAHLRKFSNYLAPRTGVLSMDTWSLGALWLRNTLLIQLTALAWLLVLFTSVYLLRLAFQGVAHVVDTKLMAVLLLAVTSVVVWVLAVNLRGKTSKLLQRGYILAGAVVPAWIGAAFLSAKLFAYAWTRQCTQPLAWPTWTDRITSCAVNSHDPPHYSDLFSAIFHEGVRGWAVLGCTFAGLLILSLFSLLDSKTREKGDTGLRVLGGVIIALLSTLLVHVCLSAVSLGMELQIQALRSLDKVSTLFAIWGPAATLLTYATAILLMIGLAGRASDGPQREWWTRYGAWVLACAAAGLAVPAVVFGGPWVVHWLFLPQHKGWVKWGTVASWIATSVGGLLAGKSSRTAGEGATRAPSLQLLANVGGGLFLLGAAMGAAELLYYFFRAEVTPPDGLGVLGTQARACPVLLLATLGVLLLCAFLFSFRFDLNVFGLSELYRNRLVRCYLGATRWQTGTRKAEPFTQFDFCDDLRLSKLAGEGFRGPFPIINCSLNLAGSSDLSLHTRHSASFTLTPVHCGSAREYVGYRKTATFAGDMDLGQAMAVSGAAASPNMGYNTAPLVALLLTLFNVRLGWWFPNPGSSSAENAGPRGLAYLLLELLGLASERRAYVNVTDGGHFENLGIYELVRRRSQLIIACDAECDETMTFSGLANAIRLCDTDFGAKIELDLASLRRGEHALSRTHSAVGLIRYSNGSVGRIIYIKASITGDEDATITQYLSSHATFPHETTANQFFKEEQFESYRRLGHHIVRNALRNVTPREPLVRVAERLMDTMTPAASTTEKFLEHTRALEQLWRQFRADHPKELQHNGFLMELMGHAPSPAWPRVDADITSMGLELLQLMENIFIDLRLDDFWEHPDHRGWALLFMSWARSSRFRMVWQQNHHTFGIRFEHFCATRLGLSKDDPVLRVSPLTRD